jgi:hypothetical protein
VNWIWTVRLLRWSYAAFIAQASVITFLEPGHSGHAAIVVHLLAGIEFLAAIIFALGIADLAACATLFAVFAVAAVMSVVNAEWPLRFFYYAATAFLIVRSVPSRLPA